MKIKIVIDATLHTCWRIQRELSCFFIVLSQYFPGTTQPSFFIVNLKTVSLHYTNQTLLLSPLCCQDPTQQFVVKTSWDRKRLPRKHLIGSQGVEFLLPKNFFAFFFVFLVVEFGYNLSFWVLSKFEFLRFVTVRVIEFFSSQFLKHIKSQDWQLSNHL